MSSVNQNTCIAIKCGLLFFTVILLAHLFIASYKTISNNLFEKKLTELSLQQKETISLAPLPVEATDRLTPVGENASIYENQNFYMFPLSKPKKQNGEHLENYTVSAYIQKPTNVIEFYMKDWYGNIITDKYIIEISLRETKSEHHLDVLQLSKKDKIKRIDNLQINTIIFQAYEVHSKDETKYFLVATLEENIALVYCIKRNGYHTIENFNYLSLVVPSSKDNFIEEEITP